ncbi:cytochrome c biogenesis protein/redoxin [Anaerocolumna chitinilytica]|uniref:Cytochrome c biogenesis protein CcsB n=1 Tax=Anaerocolumna chitinilytica TaxID=1727145 RepID=A0A7I8DQ55_9FIRM|nr:cytochrome c biogenesis protein/redoxin [Anaerocolumna chitinilytica]BCJ99225.1 cytochrome c biogenesis protein CcsB [Anaerocolumna chitinilytica]
MVGIALTSHISYVLVFMEGLLSFFSPCVIPLLPVYMGYLAGSAKTEHDGVIVYERRRVFLNTAFFVLGISFAFLLLGTSFTLLGKLLGEHRYLLIRISGILIILLGLIQLDFIQFSFLQRERKLNYEVTDKSVNPLVALVLGFTFSFAWTPCIGPALSSVLILVSGAKNTVLGFLLILLYALGFLIPFLLLGLFTSQLLNFLKRKRNLVKYTIKAGGILLIIIGFMTFTGYMNGISSYLNKAQAVKENNISGENTEDSASDKGNNDNIAGSDNKGESIEESTEEDNNGTEEYEKTNFTLTDQNGKEHTLSDYKGQVVFLNFYATWCPPCKKELPDIEKLYKEFGSNEKEVVFLGITNPKSKDYPNNSDEDEDYIKTFLADNQYSFPTLFDTTGDILQKYGISAFPTTFVFDKNGKLLGYVPGMMTEDIMRNVINQALESGE